MTRAVLRRAGAGLFSMVGIAFGGDVPVKSGVIWSALPSLPDKIGWAGMYAGTSHGVLLAAGGANFPDLPHAAGGKKVWHDRIFALEPGEGATWKEAGRLPRVGGYGVSVTWKNRVVCAGLGDVRGNYGDVWTMEWTGGGVAIEALPSLPIGSILGAGAVVGDVLYVIGGQERPDIPRTLGRIFAMNLGAPADQLRWSELPWPTEAPPRMQAVAGALDERLYLLSGLDLVPDRRGGIERRHLRDAYALEPAHGWRRLADLPNSVATAPGPAMTLPGARLAIWTGLDVPWASPNGHGPQGTPLEGRLTIYDVAADRWTIEDAEPDDRSVTTPRLVAPVVPWRGGFAIVGGEPAPGLRTSTVIFARFK